MDLLIQFYRSDLNRFAILYKNSKTNVIKKNLATQHAAAFCLELITHKTYCFKDIYCIFAPDLQLFNKKEK